MERKRKYTTTKVCEKVRAVELLNKGETLKSVSTMFKVAKSTIVREYLRSKQLPEKAILVLDNAPVHPNEKELVSGDIKVVYLPPNITSTVQPMDQNVLESMKKIYKRKFLEYLLKHLENNEEVGDALKKVNILKVIKWIAEAWDRVTPYTIARSWKGIFQDTFQPSQETDLPCNDLLHLYNLVNRLQPVGEIINMSDIQDWARDDQIEFNEDVVVDIIRDNFAAEKNYDAQQDEPNDFPNVENENEEIISHAQAFKALTTVLRYVIQENESPDTIQRVRRIQEKVKQKIH
ncbi:jerky protein homolog-like [Phlebotomus papatasi]|uniref:jerky protein homolog-like n=1 Tax=Phlebotomus papatasi TaxID=29031 RepID=UPI002483320D|nr:jerky protein homolog-like [Phlebotomus papatasi]